MSKKISLDADLIAKIKAQQLEMEREVSSLGVKKVRCKYCGFRTIDKYSDLSGHFSAFCRRCGQVAIYNAAEDCVRTSSTETFAAFG